MAQNRRPGIIQKYVTHAISDIATPLLGAIVPSSYAPAPAPAPAPAAAAAAPSIFGAPKAAAAAAAAPSSYQAAAVEAARAFTFPTMNAKKPGVPIPAPVNPSTFGVPAFALAAFPGLSSYGAKQPRISSGGNYILQVLFYLFLYGFVIFLLLVLIHYTVRPIFQFSPGGTGIVPLSTTTGYSRYWNKGTQPLITDMVPDPANMADTLHDYPFITQYSFSVDLYITDMSTSSFVDKLLFYKAGQPQTSLTPRASTDPETGLAPKTPSCSVSGSSQSSGTSVSSSPSPPTSNYRVLKNTPITSIEDTMAALPVSMICYLSKTNDVVVTFFCGKTATRYSSFPIRNVPLYTPFRVTVVVEINSFTVYLNGMQLSQTKVPQMLLNFSDTSPQQFFPNTFKGDNKCGYVQNLLLWNRPISYDEIAAIPLALTTAANFGVAASTTSNTCS